MEEIRAIGNTIIRQAIHPPESSRTPAPARANGPTPEQMKQAGKVTKLLQENLNSFNVKFDYSVHESTGTIVVKVINGETGKVIREIPPKELLALAESIVEELHGLLYDEKI